MLTTLEAELTADERAELTPFNAAAHDLLRSSNPGVVQPCWLCLSAEAKEAARAALLSHLDAMMPSILPYDVSTASALLERAARGPAGRAVQAWRDAEARYKAARAAGEPGGYFTS